MFVSTAKPRLRGGYTLVELTIVMLIMGIVAAAAVPRFNDSMDRFRVEAAASRIAADLNLVRARAMTQGSPQGVNFFTSSESYQLAGDPDIDSPGEEYWVYLSKTSYPVDLVSTTFTNTNAFTNIVAVVWDIFGQASGYAPPPNVQTPLSSGTIVIASGSEQRTVVINPVTGKASVQ